MSLWGQDAVKDVAEAVGIRDLGKDVTQALCRDVEFRLSLVLEEALKFMRHAKRTILWSQDISNALRNLDVEPLYGYETTRPLKFGEASIGPGQPLFYVEDEEMDFEKLINAPLPKVPREVSFTAHWLAVEGVQPSIPQNPTPTDARNVELLQKGPNVNPALAAMNSSDNTTTKPQVKHVLSKELQLYFAKVCESILDEVQRDYQTAALASLRDDPGLHQLVPYFVNFIADKVTHNIRDLFVLEQMMHMIDALTRNEKLYLPPYVASLTPPVLTCLTSHKLGSGGSGSLDHFALRDLAASLLHRLCTKYTRFAQNLKPRLLRVCMKSFLTAKKPFGTHYGGILGIHAIGGADLVRAIVVPNLKKFEGLYREELEGNGTGKKEEAEKLVSAVINVLGSLVDEDMPMLNGHTDDSAASEQEQLADKVGEVIGNRIADSGHQALLRAVLDA